jgi:tetratricopeptide (TPR) repeat protein
MAMLAVLCGSLWAVYGWTLRGPLIFDDEASILKNGSIVNLWPLVGEVPGPLNPLPGGPTSGRPLANLSLAINYQIGGLEPFGYHVFNLIVHTLAVLLLWRTLNLLLRLEYFGGRFDSVAELLAFAAALVWGLHPLNTETVQYVTQRTELMMGLFYIATIYCSLRYWDSKQFFWLMLASAACLCGMACKEVMATAPLMVLLLDRTLVSGSFLKAMRNFWRLYAGLALGWLLQIGLNFNAPRSMTAGFALKELPPVQWWLTQCEVLWMYLQRSVWPWPLSIHYQIPLLMSLANAWPYVAATGLLVIFTAILLWKRNAVGMVGAWVLGILSPTFIVPLLHEVAQERRMYLPLAGLATLFVAGGFLLTRMPARGNSAIPIVTMALLASTAFAAVDVHRLWVYRDDVSLWQETVDLQPNDSFAHNNLGIALAKRGRHQEAVVHFQASLMLNPVQPEARNNLGAILRQTGHPAESLEQFDEALKLEPDFTEAYFNEAESYAQLHQPSEAITAAQTALRTAHADGEEIYAKEIATWLREYRDWVQHSRLATSQP